LEYRHPLWYGKTRMVSLPDGEKISKIPLFRFGATHERDEQTDGQTPGDSIYRAYAYASRGKKMKKKQKIISGWHSE